MLNKSISSSVLENASIDAATHIDASAESSKSSHRGLVYSFFILPGAKNYVVIVFGHHSVGKFEYQDGCLKNCIVGGNINYCCFRLYV